MLFLVVLVVVEREISCLSVWQNTIGSTQSLVVSSCLNGFYFSLHRAAIGCNVKKGKEHCLVTICNDNHHSSSKAVEHLVDGVVGARVGISAMV